MASFFRSDVLSRAWEATWRHKSLWFFGLFAAILSFGEEYDVLIRNGDILDSIPRRLEQFKLATDQGVFSGFADSVRNFLQVNPAGSLSILATWAIVVLALAWLVIVSQGALIEGARRHDAGKSLNVLEGFDVGMSNFWPIFLVNVIAKIVVYGLLVVVVVPLALVFFKTGSTAAALTIMLWTFIILFPVIVIIAFVTKFANAYIVIKKYPVRQAIAGGWALFARHWLVTFELALLLVLINFLVVFAAVSTLVNAFNFPDLATWEYLGFFVVLGFVFAWLTTFQFSAWTFLFLKLQNDEAPSKLRRIIHYILDIRERPSKPVVAARPTRR
ncbi:MAG: hypothetical protein HY421_02240 [Candidatus Kerfeldbacteria bacterium]|nr:hypothetical protein [Candidatus Kerfeldbacteria bacterium]